MLSAEGWVRVKYAERPRLKSAALVCKPEDSGKERGLHSVQAEKGQIREDNHGEAASLRSHVYLNHALLFISVSTEKDFAKTWASPVAQMVKDPPAMQETWVRSLGWEDPLERAW